MDDCQRRYAQLWVRSGTAATCLPEKLKVGGSTPPLTTQSHAWFDHMTWWNEGSCRPACDPGVALCPRVIEACRWLSYADRTKLADGCDSNGCGLGHSLDRCKEGRS